MTSNLNRASRQAYRAARDLRDLRALQQGPTAFAKRQARKVAYREGNRLIRTFLRGFGL